MPSFHFRLNDDELAMLDRLTEAVKASYTRTAAHMPVFNQLARETTRSSALRDLLQAWDHGQADTAFNAHNEPEDTT